VIQEMRKPGVFRCATTLWLAGLAVAGFASAGQDPGGAARGGAAPAPAPDIGAEAPEEPVSPDIASYDIGLMLGRQLYQNGLGDTARQDELIRGLKEGLAGKVATDEQRKQANQFIKSGRDASTGRNQREAREFLEKNAKAEGVRKTASGLQYRVLAEGDPAGHQPVASDEVTVHYRAALADGVEFDSSYAHGRPATLRMSSIIKGWREALSLMRPGARWQLFVPPELAYGTTPPPAVPPGALLIYELELVRIEPPGRIEPKGPSPARAKPGDGAEALRPAPPK
jgi:FKBP-type peptidyl-prolyl cis-trans isomerase